MMVPNAETTDREGTVAMINRLLTVSSANVFLVGGSALVLTDRGSAIAEQRGCWVRRR